MEDVISFTVDIIRFAVLSGFLVYVVLIGMLIVSTVAMRRSRRGAAGYALGWLVCVMVIFIYTTGIGDVQPNVQPFITDKPVDFLLLVGPSIFGVIIGFVLLLFLTRFISSETAQSLVISLVTAISGIMLFFMSVASTPVRGVIGSFSIAFAVGSLVHIVIRGFPNITQSNE